MPGPAARVGDTTAHGGVITGPGVPNVLIGGMPASVVGDMHVCPMVTPGTPPIPHVGGPTSSPGAPTVLIGGRPAATIGSMCVCVGPPDSIVMGAPTVMLGTAGSGAGSAGSAGGGGAAGANASAAAAQFDNNESVTKEEHWLEIEFVDKAGNPVSGVPYKLEDPAGTESEGVLRLDGKVRRDALEKEGQADVTLMSVWGAQWDTSEMTTEDKVKLSAETEGFADGTPAHLVIYQRDVHGPDVVVADLKAKVQGDSVEATWRYEYPEDPAAEDDTLQRADDEPKRYSAPDYYFEVVVEPCTARASILNVTDYIEIEVADGAGEGAANQPYVLVTSAGETRAGTLDGKGKARVENIPPGNTTLRMPELPDLDAENATYEAGSEPGAAPAGAATETTGGRPLRDLRFQLLDHAGAPLAGTEYTLEIAGESYEATTDRKGWTETVQVPTDAQEAVVTTPEMTHRFEV